MPNDKLSILLLQDSFMPVLEVKRDSSRRDPFRKDNLLGITQMHDQSIFPSDFKMEDWLDPEQDGGLA